MTVRILVIEDDPGVRAVLERGLHLAGHLPHLADRIAAGREQWRGGGFDVVLLDVMLPDGDGVALLAEMRAAGDTTPTVLLTAREEVDLRDRAAAAGASEYLRKPFAYGELLACVTRLTARP